MERFLNEILWLIIIEIQLYILFYIIKNIELIENIDYEIIVLYVFYEYPLFL